MRVWVLLAICMVTGCGQATASTTPPAAVDPASAVEARLAHLADAQARAGGNTHPRFAAFVETRRKIGVRISESGDVVDTDQPVWVVEVVGPFRRYPVPSMPFGSKSSGFLACTAISFTVDQASWRILDDGCGPDFDLRRLGRPHRLDL
jgi:hypothetical protein